MSHAGQTKIQGMVMDILPDQGKQVELTTAVEALASVSESPLAKMLPESARGPYMNIQQAVD
eukprot:5491589-Amphidinium_carterae.1